MLNNDARRYLKIIIIIIYIFKIFLIKVHAGGSDVRASGFRNGLVGAEYVSMGMAPEALIDDVFSIYWNPAGLANILRAGSLPPDNDGGSGADKEISDNDLINFSGGDEKYMGLGLSGAFYRDSQAGFIGAGFRALDGVIGAAIVLLNRTESGKSTVLRGDQGSDSFGSAGYISYGREIGPLSAGMSFKAFNEKAGDIRFYGFGADAGLQLEIIPLLCTGLVVQDIATTFRAYDDAGGNADDESDFCRPALKFSAALRGISDFLFSFTGIWDDGDYMFNYGAGYNLRANSSISLGVSDYSALCAGFSYGFSRGKFAYSFYYKWDGAYSVNIISMIYEI